LRIVRSAKAEQRCARQVLVCTHQPGQTIAIQVKFAFLVDFLGVVCAEDCKAMLAIHKHGACPAVAGL